MWLYLLNSIRAKRHPKKLCKDPSERPTTTIGKPSATPLCRTKKISIILSINNLNFKSFMWLINSSIGRKVVMALTGVALVLFLTFHMSMNVVALFSGEGYNMICEFLGANWYAVVATMGLAALCVLHIVYAFWLTMQNRAARGNSRYEVTAKPKGVEWASQNMLVLGIIVVLGLLLHLFNFWYNMMFAELLGFEGIHGPADGFEWIKETFANPVFVVLYIVWLVALWFHLTHGFWSAMQTFGWNGKVWFNRWKVISQVYSTLLILGFLVVVVLFALGCAPSLCCGSCC